MALFKFFAPQKQAQKGEETVEHQQFLAEVVVPKMLGSSVKSIAEQGRGDADIRHQTVFGLSVCKESEGKQSEQWAIGIAGEDIDGIDE